MANEITYASLGDLRVAALLHKELQYLLHDPTDLRTTMSEVPFISRAGSSVMKTGQVQPVYSMSAPGEITGVANTALTDASFNLTVAKYNLQQEVSDLAQITAPEGGLDIAKLASMAAMSVSRNLSSMLTALFPTVTANVTDTGVDLDVDDIYAAQYLLQSALVPGPYYCVLFPEQWNNFQEALRGEAGATQFSPATNEQLAIRGPGFKGTWNGIEFYADSSVNSVNAGADSCGCMYGQGAFAYTEADMMSVEPYLEKFARIPGLKALVEFQRPYVAATGGIGGTALVTHTYPAVALAEDARAVKIVTDR